VALPPLIDAAGRVALITGAAGGIGRATVDLFLAAGAKVVALDLDRAGLPAESAALIPVAADAADEQSVRSAVRCAIERFGRLDFVVSAAGAAGGGPLACTALAEWKRLIDINLTSAFLLARECHPHLVRPGGAMVMISSTNGRNGGSQLSGAAYAVAKAGIINLARYLAREWAPEGLRVNTVVPGPVATPMLDRFSAAQHAVLKESVPLKRYADAAEIAAAIGYLCSEHAASMTGACINVSGGLILD
jgi:NAD(P)-dependent dehydrogenase (short-subunit alcohol dehydrogenase family)